MPLFISNSDVQSVLTMPDCVDALGQVFGDHALGLTANRPRSHTYTPVGTHDWYMFKSMDGSWPRERVHALRLSSDRVSETVSDDGILRRHKPPVAPGGRWLGLVLLFDLDTTELLAVMHDGYLQRMRVGATSAVAARHLARADARSAGMFGTGWQAGAQLMGLQHVLPELERVVVFSPDARRRASFAAEWRERLQLDVRAADAPEDVLDGADVVIGATNALQPVIHGRALAPGVHVNSVQGHELDGDVLRRADLIVVRERERPTFHTAGDRWPEEAAGARTFTSDEDRKVVTLGEVVAGRAGRRSPEDITVFGGGGMGGSAGLGVQFAAVAARVYRAAREAGAGTELPTDLFLQDMKP